MWKCPNCKEELDDQFDACWNCETTRDGVRPKASSNEDARSDSSPAAEKDTTEAKQRVSTDERLTQILQMQEKQQEALADVRFKVGCLFFFMVFGIVLRLALFFLSE